MAYSQLHEESQDAIDQEYGAYLQSFLKNQLYPLLWKQLHESLPVEEIRGLRLPNPKPTTYRLKVQRRDTRATRPRIRLARTHTCADRELHNELHECWQGYVVPVVEASQCSSSSSTEPRESAPEPLEGSNSSRCDLACSETLDFGESNEENPGASGADVNFNLPAFFNKKPDTLDEDIWFDDIRDSILPPLSLDSFSLDTFSCDIMSNRGKELEGKTLPTKRHYTDDYDKDVDLLIPDDEAHDGLCGKNWSPVWSYC